MKSHSFCRHLFGGASFAVVGACLLPGIASASILVTTDPAAIAAFQSGATIETFDDLTAFGITSYGAGQNVSAAESFSSRDGATKPTFHSGGGSFNDPVGNPGTPIGIVAPGGTISGDVVSLNNVAAPLVVGTTELFNRGFMEIIFPDDVARVGFWVTHGTISLDLRDDGGTTHTTGDFAVTVTAKQFVGISRDNADVKVAALIGVQGTEAFTIDDMTYSTTPLGSSTTVPEAGTFWSVALAGVGIGCAGVRRHLKRR